MADDESWQDAFMRIYREVEDEMPRASEATKYKEYRLRCHAWKRERGLM